MSIERVLTRALVAERSKQSILGHPERSGIEITSQNRSVGRGILLGSAYLQAQITSMNFHIFISHNAIYLSLPGRHSQVQVRDPGHSDFDLEVIDWTTVNP